MPARKQITKEAIIQAALDILRRDGFDGVNARSLARELQCSTQPIYLSFHNMEELKDTLLHRADEVYRRFVSEEPARAQYPPYKASGMAYIRFAKEEKEMFKLLFMRERTREQVADEDKFLDEYVQIISKMTGLDSEAAHTLHLEMWAFGHGIATMIVTGYFDLPWDTVSEMMSDAYLGFRDRHLSKQREGEI